jgi:hypothetical protein
MNINWVRSEGWTNPLEYLPDDANQLVVNELAAFQTRFFQPLDLLLDYNFKGCCPDEQCWSRTLLCTISDNSKLN